MIAGRYLPMIFVVTLAASLAAQRAGVVNAGTLRTHTPMLVGLMIGAALITVGLEYFPALALGTARRGRRRPRVARTHHRSRRAQTTIAAAILIVDGVV